MEIVVERITIQARPVLECGACHKKELTRLQTFEVLDAEDIKHFSPYRYNVDINVGWCQNGRGNYTCPNCKGK